MVEQRVLRVFSNNFFPVEVIIDALSRQIHTVVVASMSLSRDALTPAGALQKLQQHLSGMHAKRALCTSPITLKRDLLK